MNLFAQELAWTRCHMPLTGAAIAQLPSLDGMRLACSMHLDIKVVPLLEALLARGTAVFLSTCNPATVRDEVVAHLLRQGTEAYAWRGMDDADYRAGIAAALAWEPTHLCEVGADLTSYLHQQSLADNGHTIQAALEATGSGIDRLRQIGQPRYPIFNWDDIPVKEGLHNRYMVGLSAWQTFLERTHLTLHGKQVVVIGYGLVGQGVAEAASAFGGAVTIAEKTAAAAWQARFAGWPVATLLSDILPQADVVVTATGATGVIGPTELSYFKPGAFLFNVGHTATEIDIAALRQYPHQTVLPHIERFDIDGKPLFLLAEGAMFNLTAGYGDSLNAFDITMAILTAGIGHMSTVNSETAANVYMLPQSVWEAVL